MNTWLVGFTVETGDVERMVYHMVTAQTLEVAEAGVMAMGRTWWPALKREDDGHRWLYPDGDVWFNSIILLDDLETRILHGLKFLDTWRVFGKPEAPVVCDEWGDDWRDITR